MADQFYRLKEILFGLHSVYQMNQEELKHLKDLCYVRSSIVSDFNFLLEKDHVNMPPRLVCIYDFKNLKIRNLVIYLRHFFNLYPESDFCHVVDPKLSRISSNPFYPVHIRNGSRMIDLFSKQAQLILNSDFAKYTGELYIRENHINLELLMNYIQFHIARTAKHMPASTVLYDARKSRISFTVYQEDMKGTTVQLIEHILNMPIPVRKIPKYHLEQIRLSPLVTKEIILAPFDPGYTVQFEIEEQEEQIVLSKVKN